MTDPAWDSFRRDYLENKEKMERSRITEVSEVSSIIDNLKVEIHGRFRHLLNSLAALEARLCKVEASLGIVIKPWVPIDEELEPIGPYGKSFHSLNIRKMVDRMREKCPRCQGPLWRKEGLGYLNRGHMVQKWKCRSCKYEEERFVL